MSEQKTPAITPDAINEILNEGRDLKSMTLETLILLINMERLRTLRDKTHNEFSELKKRQDQVRKLHSVLKKINKATTQNGELDCTQNEELQQALREVKDYGVEINEKQIKYSKEDKDRLVENIRMTLDDLNVLNDMQLQTINRLTNERYESYQLARAILKPLHEAKMQSARAIK